MNIFQALFQNECNLLYFFLKNFKITGRKTILVSNICLDRKTLKCSSSITKRSFMYIQGITKGGTVVHYFEKKISDQKLKLQTYNIFKSYPIKP